MYLSLLNNRQKELFLMMAYHLANTDGDFSESEQMMMNSYAGEMGISPDISKTKMDISKVIDALCSTAGKREKQIIVFELIGLAMADSNYDASERKVIREMAEKFGVDTEFEKFCEKKLTEYLELQNALNEMILN